MEKEESNSQSEVVESKSAIDIVNEVKKELSEYRRPFEKDWREQDNAYYGKQHKTGEDKKNVKNHIFKIIEGEVPILTDSMPGTQVTASTEEKQADADILNKAIKFVYQDQNLPLRIPTLVRSALTSAPGYLYVFYNPDADGGEGKIEYKQLDWENVFLDGNVDTIEQSEKVRIEIPCRRESVARMWPEKRAEILEMSQDKDSKGVSDPDHYEDRDHSNSKEGMGKPHNHKAKDIVKYVETWVKSYDLEEIPEEDTLAELEKEKAQLLGDEVPDVGKWENHDTHIQGHSQLRGEVLAQINLPPDAPIEMVSQTIEQLLQANPEAQDLAAILLTVKKIDNHIEEHNELKKLNPEGKRPKYPDGWRLIKSVGKTVLFDGPNPELIPGRDGHIPLVPFYCYKDTTIYGFSEVKNILNPQRTLNWMDNAEYDGLLVSSNPGWTVDHEAGVKDSDLTNEPGIVIKKKRGTEVARLQPGQVSQQLTQRKEMDESAMEQISGMNEATQGQLPSSGASGITVQKLQTQAIGRIRLKDRYLQHYSMRRLAIITAILIENHWTSEKRFRLRSDDSQIEDVIFNPIDIQQLDYEISIAPGSMAGIDKDALNALYLNLYTQSGGQMTFEDLLLVSDFPKKDILLKRIKERTEQAQTTEQLQAEIERLMTENAALIGLANPAMLESEQKKVYEVAAKSALLEKIMQEQAQVAQPQVNQPGVNEGQPVNQGNM